MSMEIDLEAIRQAFLVESEEALSAMEEALVALESRPDDREPLHEIFRTVHTIKGSAAMVGFDNVSEFAHLLEDSLELVRSGAVHVTPTHVTTLLQTVDAMRGLLKGAANGQTTHVRAADRALIARLVPGGDGALGSDSSAGGVSGGAASGSAAARARRRTLRVGMDRLDTLLNLTGEAAVARGRLMQLLAQRQAASATDVFGAAEEVERLFVELQEQVMRMRLVPLGPFFRQHLRTVRD
ncbi:MAG TPA: Hpt domain-containing protein, partial [Gaiellaceae bacterium]|nr:Hpt domain-containing protein [Gaiellaceae bacterium]